MTLTTKNGIECKVEETLELSDKMVQFLIESNYQPVSYLVSYTRRTRKGTQNMMAVARVAIDGTVCLFAQVAA